MVIFVVFVDLYRGFSASSIVTIECTETYVQFLHLQIHPPIFLPNLCNVRQTRPQFPTIDENQQKRRLLTKTGGKAFRVLISAAV